MNIRFKLILPAMTDDYEDQYITFAKKHSDIIATDYVIHEYRKTFVLYNKQYVNKESDDIAKVFIVSKKDAEESYIKELEELEKIRNIDPTHSFTVPFKGASYGMNPTLDISFSLNSEPKNIVKDIHTGLDFDYKKTYNPPLVFYQIILGDGGDELNKSKDKITYSQFLVTLKNFTEGFILLHKGG